jgi:signal transduction histidine kinase
MWFINRTFLSDYYLYSKIDALDETYGDISNIYADTEDGTLTDQDAAAMERLETKYNVDAYVFNVRKENVGYFWESTRYVWEPSFPTQENISDRTISKINRLVQEYTYDGSNLVVINKKILKETNNFKIFLSYDSQMETTYIDLVGVFESNNSVKISLLRSNFESIEESAAIANKFLAYIGIVTVVLGTAAMLIISKKFTKPILDLAGIAKKISDLDFDIRYEVTTKDEIGELGTSINILSDKLETTISELKKANNELLTDIQKKTELDEMRKEFLSNVSHELKTPISLIQGYAEGLKENINEDAESRDFYCDVIMDEANKMNQMVKKLLSLNELEFGNNQMNFERFDIVALIRSVLDATDILFKQKEAVLHFYDTEPVFVWADEYLVEQVVTNYVSNALNHVSGPKIIEIKLIRHNDVIRIAVYNTGDNIPEEDLDKIWIKFYKVDKARTREYGGNGIGLSIVKAIINSLNRDCGVINHPSGVEFWFELDTKA